MIDTHIHLQHQRYHADLSAVIDRAISAGVTAMIVPGTDLESSAQAIALARDYTTGNCRIYAAVGVHPTSAHNLDDRAMDRLRDLAQEPQVVAIGEIGLDHYWPRVKDRGWVCPEPPAQREAFERQLALAVELDLPVIIHDRDAHVEVLEGLYSTRAASHEAAARLRGSLHAYAGGTVHLARTVALGFHIGMDGPVTFKKAAALQAVAREVPLDRLLLETDGPYLTPHPHRGQRNEPAYVRYVAQKIAALRDTAFETIVEATSANARRLFGI